MTGLVDSDLARCLDTRGSVTVFLFLLGCCIISWQSKEQTSVALSSMEAENMAESAATQEADWLSRLLKEFGCSLLNLLQYFKIIKRVSEIQKTFKELRTLIRNIILYESM